MLSFLFLESKHVDNNSSISVCLKLGAAPNRYIRETVAYYKMANFKHVYVAVTNRTGRHWSVSHDAWWSAAVVGRARVGIDVERLQSRREEMVDALISDAEREHLAAGLDATVFARIWTAKEAVLKSVGVGLGELSRCVTQG